MRRLVILLAVMGAMVALSAGAALPQAASETVVDTQRVSYTVANPCNGEFVLLTGHETIVSHLTTKDNETVAVISQYTFQASGVGEITGANYQVNNTSHASKTVHTGNTATIPNHYNVIGAGQVPDFTLYGLEHFTLTPNGMSFHFSNSSSECKG
jgi:hypothetical protein